MPSCCHSKGKEFFSWWYYFVLLTCVWRVFFMFFLLVCLLLGCCLLSIFSDVCQVLFVCFSSIAISRAQWPPGSINQSHHSHGLLPVHHLVPSASVGPGCSLDLAICCSGAADGGFLHPAMDVICPNVSWLSSIRLQHRRELMWPCGFQTHELST